MEIKDKLIHQIAKELLKLEYCDFEFISNLQDKLIRLQSSEIRNLKIKLKKKMEEKMESKKCPVKDCDGIMKLETNNNKTYFKCNKCKSILRK